MPGETLETIIARDSAPTARALDYLPDREHRGPRASADVCTTTCVRRTSSSPKAALKVAGFGTSRFARSPRTAHRHRHAPVHGARAVSRQAVFARTSLARRHDVPDAHGRTPYDTPSPADLDRLMKASCSPRRVSEPENQSRSTTSSSRRWRPRFTRATSGRATARRCDFRRAATVRAHAAARAENEGVRMRHPARLKAREAQPPSAGTAASRSTRDPSPFWGRHSDGWRIGNW